MMSSTTDMELYIKFRKRTGTNETEVVNFNDIKCKFWWPNKSNDVSFSVLEKNGKLYLHKEDVKISGSTEISGGTTTNPSMTIDSDVFLPDGSDDGSESEEFESLIEEYDLIIYFQLHGYHTVIVDSTEYRNEIEPLRIMSEDVGMEIKKEYVFEPVELGEELVRIENAKKNIYDILSENDIYFSELETLDKYPSELQNIAFTKNIYFVIMDTHNLRYAYHLEYNETENKLSIVQDEEICSYEKTYDNDTGKLITYVSIPSKLTNIKLDVSEINDIDPSIKHSTLIQIYDQYIYKYDIFNHLKTSQTYRLDDVLGNQDNVIDINLENKDTTIVLRPVYSLKSLNGNENQRTRITFMFNIITSFVNDEYIPNENRRQLDLKITPNSYDGLSNSDTDLMKISIDYYGMADKRQDEAILHDLLHISGYNVQYDAYNNAISITLSVAMSNKSICKRYCMSIRYSNLMKPMTLNLSHCISSLDNNITVSSLVERPPSKLFGVQIIIDESDKTIEYNGKDHYAASTIIADLIEQ